MSLGVGVMLSLAIVASGLLIGAGVEGGLKAAGRWIAEAIRSRR